MATQLLKMAIRGHAPGNTETTIAIATINSLSTEGFFNSDGINMDASESPAVKILQAVQKVVSAKITKFSLSADLSQYTEEVLEDIPPGDELEANEIFQDDFSDTEVVPTLQLVNVNDDGKGNNAAAIKYMADPEETTNFDTNVKALGNLIADHQVGNKTFSIANMTLTAKEEVTRND